MRLRVVLLGLVAAVCICLAVWLLLTRKHNVFAYSEQETRYYRAVYVLQHIDTAAAQEQEDIPRAVQQDDSANALLHHPDRVFVLRELAAQLEALVAVQPKAALYATYARLGLGQHVEGARLLSAYVAQAPYAPAQYSLLCKALHAAHDYAALYLISMEWREHDASCIKARTVYTFAALYQLERYEEAASVMLQERDCLGFEAEVYAARALMAAGDIVFANHVVQNALQTYPEQVQQIEMMWHRLQTQVLF